MRARMFRYAIVLASIAVVAAFVGGVHRGIIVPPP
jgi:hypothetical protein